MRVDFSDVEDVDQFVSVPEGIYACVVEDVNETTTRDGRPRFWFRLMIEEGDFAGRLAAVDGVSLTHRAMARAKHVLSALGVDVSGEVEVTRELLEGRHARVQVVLEEREDPATGRRTVRTKVPYLGYTAPDDERDPDEDVPWDRRTA